MSSEAPAPKKQRSFRKFYFRGLELEKLLDLSPQSFLQICSCRARRRAKRGISLKEKLFMSKLCKAKKNLPKGEKPPVVKTHLRNVMITPQMIGSMVGIYNGKSFIQVEIRPEMIGRYLGEFSLTYKPVSHGRPGIGATHSSRFIPLK